ncbi:MAG: MarR family transcriptional regulator [Pseudomonadota bacterium]
MNDATLLALETDRLMRRIEAQLARRAPAIDPAKVGPLGGMALLTLAEIEPAPTQALTTRMGRDKSQMTRLIHMLETKGMLTRTPCERDGRVTILALTPAGHALLVEIRKLMSEVMTEILEPLDANDRRRLAGILGRL